MTINAVQNYTRLMAPVFSDLESIPVLTFFLHLFANGETIVEQDAEAIDIDIQRGNKRISAYIPRGSDAVNNDLDRALHEKYTSDSKLFPLIEEITPITSTMIGKRMPGEPVYQPMTRSEKQAALAMKAHREHMNRIIRKMELSAAEAFRTSKQTVDNGAQFDFYRRASHNVNAGTVWSDSSGAAPISDIAGAGDKVYRDGNRMPTDVIFSGQSWDEFLLTTAVQNIADSRRIVHFAADMNVTAPAGYESWVAAGAVFQGQLKAGDWKLNMWTYPGVYDNDSGTVTQYLPDEETLVFSANARYDRYFGPKDRVEVQTSFFEEMFGLSLTEELPMNVQDSGIFRSDMFHVDAYAMGNNKGFNVRTQTAPIFPTVETDTIVKIAT